MKAREIYFRRIRLILDCTLLLAVLLVIMVSFHSTQAKPAAQASPQTILIESSQDLSAQFQLNGAAEVTQAITNSVTLDNNMLAALMAAENAALTSPQYLNDLPIITR